MLLKVGELSLFMFIFMGLAPMSAAVTGWVMRGITPGQPRAAALW